MANYKQLLHKITTFVFDVDGVLTDGNVILAESGEQLRTMNVKDGYALQLAVKKGYRIVIISGGKSNAVYKRFEYLGVKDIFLGIDNKLKVFNEFISNNKIELNEVLYMGDDIPDYEIMKEVGVATCPLNSAEEIKSISMYISNFKGGEGCVRDILEQVMKVQGKWLNSDAFHW